MYVLMHSQFKIEVAKEMCSHRCCQTVAFIIFSICLLIIVMIFLTVAYITQNEFLIYITIFIIVANIYTTIYIADNFIMELYSEEYETSVNEEPASRFQNEHLASSILNQNERKLESGRGSIFLHRKRSVTHSKPNF